MAANGYFTASIEQICQVAYVGTKGFYEIFESKEACYIALLDRIAADTGAVMAEAMEQAPAHEEAAIPRLVAVFAHALVDDPRVARVTFGASSGTSPAIEHQKRANRRWAAEFVESIWRQYDRAVTPAPRLAIGVIGGLFDLIADWLLTADPSEPSDRQQLVGDLTAFFGAVQRGSRPQHGAATAVAVDHSPGSSGGTTAQS